VTEELMTARQELEELAEAYLEADKAEKEAKSSKDLLRGPILELISEVVRDEVPLAEKKVTVPRVEVDDPHGGDIRAWALMNYPAWTVESVEATDEAYTVTLRESDELARFEFVVDGFKWGRTVAHYDPQLDVDALREDPDFQALDGAEYVIVEKTYYELDDKAAAALLKREPASAVVFARHTTPGRVQPRLLPFSRVEEEE
jgi:hypothetical protein